MTRLLVAVFAVAAVAADRPNVVLILADDLRPQLGCYGDPVAVTPHLDRFAGQAVRFDRAYCQAPICSPSRNSFLSGLRPATTGLRGFGTPVRAAVPDVVTLPEHFKRHGYHTAAVGKVFHVYAESGLGSEDDPPSWSAPLVRPARPVWGPEQERVRQRRTNEARARGVEFKRSQDWPRAATWDAPDVPDDDLQDGEIAATAVALLTARAKKPAEPFLLAVGFLKPHLPFVAPKKYWDLYDPAKLAVPPGDSPPPRGAPDWAVPRGVVTNYADLPAFDAAFYRKYLHAYLACVSYADACAGRVLAALDDLKLADNTVVLVLGDHGYQMGEYGSWGHKQCLYEISTRVPLLVAAPGKAAGRSTTALVELLDLYPTLAELAGLPPPARADGRSFAEVLADPTAAGREAAYSEMPRGGFLGRAARTADFRYVEWTGKADAVVARELYDHRTDPGETENVAGKPEHAAVVAELSARLKRDVPPRPARRPKE